MFGNRSMATLVRFTNTTYSFMCYSFYSLVPVAESYMWAGHVKWFLRSTFYGYKSRLCDCLVGITLTKVVCFSRFLKICSLMLKATRPTQSRKPSRTQI